MAYAGWRPARFVAWRGSRVVLNSEKGETVAADLYRPDPAAVSLLQARAGPGRDRGVAQGLTPEVRMMSSEALVPCPDCAHDVSRLAETCPSCGRPLRAPTPREGLFLRTLNRLVALGFWGSLLLLVAIAIAVFAGVLMSR